MLLLCVLFLSDLLPRAVWRHAARMAVSGLVSGASLLQDTHVAVLFFLLCGTNGVSQRSHDDLTSPSGVIISACRVSV